MYRLLQDSIRSKLMNILSECQTAWIRVRLQDTRRLIQIQAIRIHVRHFGRDWSDINVNV